MDYHVWHGGDFTGWKVDKVATPQEARDLYHKYRATDERVEVYSDGGLIRLW